MTYRLSKKMPNQSREFSNEREGKRKFFFVVEGEKTETIYLREVSMNIKQDALIDIRILERVRSSHSNQYSITQKIQQYIQSNEKLNKLTIEQLESFAQQYEDDELNEDELLENLKSILDDDTDILVFEFNQNIIEQINALSEISTYEKDFDKICLILDRDYRSFKDSQYDEVLKICEDENFLLGITNPNFEFYLLLHIDDCSSLDLAKIEDNPKKTANKKYVEYELNNKIGALPADSLITNRHYKKNNYDANFFVKKFSEFKKNIQNYESNNIYLKDNIGSSLQHILDDLLE